MVAFNNTLLNVCKMNCFLDCNIYKPIFFKEEEVRHIRETAMEKPRCKEDVLLDILATCQVTSPESIVGLAISDFDSACK